MSLIAGLGRRLAKVILHDQRKGGFLKHKFLENNLEFCTLDHGQSVLNSGPLSTQHVGSGIGSCHYRATGVRCFTMGGLIRRRMIEQEEECPCGGL